MLGTARAPLTLTPGESSAAGLSRGAATPLVQQFTPARWPVVVGAVAAVASICGLLGVWNNAPVGNRLQLTVEPACPSPSCLTAAAAAEAELTGQLRALKLEVGNPADGRRAAMRVVARVGVEPDASVAFAAHARIDLTVVVVDDDAGGSASAEMVGFGENDERAAENAGTVAAWAAAGHVAALVAPQLGRDMSLRRVTDGRGALRVFARSRAELLLGRQDRLNDVANARALAGHPSVALSRPGEHARLLAAVDETHALLAVEDREPVLIPTTRRQARIVAGLQHLEVRNGNTARRVLDAYSFPGTAAVSGNGRFAAVVVLDGNGEMAVCRVALDGGARACQPLGDVATAQGAWVSDDGGDVVATVSACLSDCLHEVLWWTPADGATRRTPVENPSQFRLRGNALEWREDGSVAQWRMAARAPVRAHVAPVAFAGAEWRAERAGGGAVETSPAPDVVLREQLIVESAAGERRVLVSATGSDWTARLSPGGGAVFLEQVQPDPDAHVEWCQVRRVDLPRP